jgi:hypothetical protein
VDDVLFGASYQITQEMISSLHINTVVVVDEKGQNSGLMKNGPDPLAVATAQGLVKKITVNHKITGKLQLILIMIILNVSFYLFCSERLSSQNSIPERSFCQSFPEEDGKGKGILQ